MLFSATYRQSDAQGQDFRSVVSCIHLLPQSVQQNQIEFVIFRFHTKMLNSTNLDIGIALLCWHVFHVLHVSALVHANLVSFPNPQYN